MRRSPRAASVVGLAPLVAASLLVGGCTVGSGTGKADGHLMDVGCNEKDPLKMLQPYSLQPSFFAGEPIEDVCPSPPGKCSGPRTNRLVIRMQHTGNRVEVNDTLYFDIRNSYKVAQCVRGEVSNGVPQWDQRFVTGADGQPVTGLRWCDWNAPDALPPPTCPVTSAADAAAADAGADAGAPVAMASSHARINLSTEDFVTASLAPLYTCVEARSVAVALPGSWIEFQNFGLAAQPCLSPEQRQGVTDDFKVDWGQRLTATFHLILGDQAVEHALKVGNAVPDQRISGDLDGSFDFDLDRGRAAQPFP